MMVNQSVFNALKIDFKKGGLYSKKALFKQLLLHF